MTTREPAVAGRFYPGTPERLRQAVAGLVDVGAPKGEVVGALMPHAGYQYSGAVAGATISRVRLGAAAVIVGPSHTGLGQPFSIMTEGTWRTPLGDVPIDAELARSIAGNSDFLREDHLAHLQEHSVEVQLPFLQHLKPDIRMVPIVVAHDSGAAYREIGRAIAGGIQQLDRDAVVIASGDMTHYEPQKTAQEKDQRGIEAILALDADELLRRVSQLPISMCAYGPAACMIAAVKDLGAGTAELVRYQTSGDVTGDYSAVVGYAGIIVRRGGPSPLVRLARQAVETYVLEGRRLRPEVSSPEMESRAGVFVSIHKHHELRGCIGTFEPVEANVAEETVANAISSATRDPRFMPVTADELKDLEYSVDVLSTPEPISSEQELDPKRYGVIVEAGWRRGLLLPDLEGVESVEQQIDICRRKAGIGPNEKVNLYRFQVKRYH